jgi:hypothetical protein
MIRITIEKISEVEYTETKTFCTHREPAGTENSGDYNRERTVYKEDFETKIVPQSRTEITILLMQEIPEDITFNISAVIRAINNLSY